jgi:ribonucleoside-diphosphate reductase beta chain
MSSVSLSPQQLDRLVQIEKEYEPFLIPSKDRFGSIPIRNTTAWEFYKKAEKVMWTADEISWEVDKTDWNLKLKPEERTFIAKTLSFFYNVDGMIMENLVVRFFGEVQCPSVRAFYSFQIAGENVHNETYGKAIRNLINDKAEEARLRDGITTDPYIKLKGEWVNSYFEKHTTFAERLVAYAMVEGIFFQASFCAIFWLKQRKLMPGLCFSNELISRDENLHFEFAAWLYNQLVYKLPDKDIYAILSRAVDIECQFVTSILPVNLIGINSSSMCDYVKFMADRFCTSINIPKLYNVQNPFDWMDLISMDGKTNFFERRTAEYQRFPDSDQQMYYDDEQPSEGELQHIRKIVNEKVRTEVLQIGNHRAKSNAPTNHYHPDNKLSEIDDTNSIAVELKIPTTALSTNNNKLSKSKETIKTPGPTNSKNAIDWDKEVEF